MQLRIIFLTVFLYLVGFGIVIPMIPVLARDFGATPLQVGLLMSVYSGVQFLFSPFWGRLSDKMGRKPILLMCLAGEAISYLVFAMAKNLEWLFVARLMAGFFAGSISTASAYISDITPPKERSKGMALIGAAFGLGFLIGPALGGLLMTWGQSLSQEKHFGTSFTALWVAGFCLFIFAFALKYLTESLTTAQEISTEKQQEKRPHRIKMLLVYIATPLVGPLIFTYFLSSFAMSTMEATLILFMNDRYLWGVKEVSYGFAYIGLVSVFCQGFLVRRLLPKLGERRMMVIGFISMGISLASIPFAPNLSFMALVMTLLGVGSSFTNPSVLGSISLVSRADEQGVVMGIAQSAASLGRIVGPALGGLLFQKISFQSPFVLAGFLAWAGLSVVITLFKKLPESAKQKKCP